MRISIPGDARKPIKSTSRRTEADRAGAVEDYRAEEQARLDRMAEQRASRLSAAAQVRMKNRAD